MTIDFTKLCKICAVTICLALAGWTSQTEPRELTKDRSGFFTGIGHSSLGESADTTDEIQLYWSEFMPFTAKVYHLNAGTVPYIKYTDYVEEGGPHYGIITAAPAAKLVKSETTRFVSRVQIQELFEMAVATKMNAEEQQSRTYCYAHVAIYFEMRQNNVMNYWSVPSCGNPRFAAFMHRVRNVEEHLEMYHKKDTPRRFRLNR